ncbi:MAG: hypothetical protein WBW88_05135 [Rhodothermales bacterium]
MKKLLAVLAILIALSLLNPDMRDFREHVENEVGNKLSSESGSAPLGRLGGGAVALLAEQVSVRKNYLLFSVYTIDLDGPDREGNDWQFLGIAGAFLKLREPEHSSSEGSRTGS